LEKQIREAENDPGSADNPISQAIDLWSLRQSKNPQARSNAEILALLQELLSRLAEVKDILRPVPYPLPPAYLPVTGPYAPPPALSELEATLARRLYETSGLANPTGPSGPTNWEGATGPTGAPEPTGRRGGVGPLGPLAPPPDSLRGAANSLFSKLAGEAPPSGAFPPDSPAEAKKPRRAKRKDPDEAR